MFILKISDRNLYIRDFITSCGTFEKNIVNWIKKLLGIDEMQSKLTRIEKSNSEIISRFEEKAKKPNVQNFDSLTLLNPVTKKQIFSFEKTDNLIPIQEYFNLLNTNKLDEKIKDFEYIYPFSDEFKATFIQPLKDVEKNGS